MATGTVENNCPLGHRNDQMDKERQHSPLSLADVIHHEDRRVRSEKEKAAAREAGTLMTFWTCWNCGVVWRTRSELLLNRPPPGLPPDLESY